MKNCLPLLANAHSLSYRVLRYFPRVIQVLLVYLISGFACINTLHAGIIKIESSAKKSPLFKSVTGKITNSKNEPVSGVSVNLKNSKTGTTSNENGDYSINMPNATGTLIFSHIGYSDQEVEVTANTTVLNVRLEEIQSTLNDVVVVGYGTQKKATITGAVSSIKSEDLMRTPAVAATSALVGKVPGITARSTDNRPGNGTSIQIRNLGAPLYVIDGVPYSTSEGATSFGFNTGISGQNLFNQLGLEDIESISILKDASAAVYGLRASNGVVLVTTKKGRRGETSNFNVSGYYGLQNFTRFNKPGSAAQYVRGRLESEQNLGRSPSLLYTKEQLAKWEAGTEKGYKSYNYFDMVTRPNVPQYYISANASGGSQKSNYYFSISHVDQNAIIKDYTFDRTNIQANLNATVFKGMQIGAQISGRLEKHHNVGVPGLDDYTNPLLSISSMWPTESPYANDNSKYINQTHNVNVNPATYKNDVTGYIDELYRSMNINLTAQYDTKFGLTLKGLYSYNYTNEDFDGFEYTYNAYIYDPITDTYNNRSAAGALYGNQNPWREKHKRNIFARFAQLQANYSKQFGDHSFSAVAAYERSDNENSYFLVHTIPPNNTIPTQLFSNQDVLTDDWSTEARAGYVGRLNYSYQGKYLLEVLGRYDGSYLYAKGSRWGFFPGVSAGWRISEEPFMKKSGNGFITDLKLRASYGETGSEIGYPINVTRAVNTNLYTAGGSAPDPFSYLPGYTFAGTGVDDGRSAVLDGNYVIGLRPRGLPITNLSWVKNQSKNIGIDIAVLNGKISGQFDVFERKRTGLPAARYDVLVPSEVGYSLPNENLTSDATRGMEGMLTYSNKLGAFDYSVAANGTFARRRDLQPYKPRFGNAWDEYRNSTVDRWSSINWGYHVIGRFESQQDIDNYKIDNDNQGNRSQLPGDFKYEDVNGDHIINALDQRPIGYAEGAQPYVSFGFNGRVAYKSFTLSVDFAGANMQSYFRDNELKYPFQNNGNSPAYMFEDHWHRVDPYDPGSAWVAGTYPAFRKDLTTHVNYNPIGGNRSDFWLTNVHYLRLKNLELGYNLPKSLLDRIGVARCRVYVNGTNLISFDNVKEFQIDPEISLGSGLIYPQQRLVNFGFNISFK